MLHWLGQEHANYNWGCSRPMRRPRSPPTTSPACSASGASHGAAAAAILKAQPVHLGRHPESLRQAAASACAEQWLCRQTWRLHRALRARVSANAPDTRSTARSESSLDWAASIYGWAETRDEQLQLVRHFLRTESPSIRRHGCNGHLRCPPPRLLSRDRFARRRRSQSPWLGYIRLDDKMLATFSGARGHDRLVIVLCSLAEGDRKAVAGSPADQASDQ